MDTRDIKKTVREKYGSIASKNSAGCCSSSCCGIPSAKELSRQVGYSDAEISAVPEGSNLGLGCGNPTALAALKEGEIVLDLGAGAGFDCFLAAQQVGPGGKVIGVDMTPEMLEKARYNAQQGNYKNVEFRMGEIEHLPVADNHVDVIISNCVINLSPEKEQVFREAFRVLKPGGKFFISDIVLLKELPENIKNSVEGYVGCVAGAALKENYLGAIEKAGFRQVEILKETRFPVEAAGLVGIPEDQAEEAVNTVASIKVTGIKPNRN